MIQEIHSPRKLSVETSQTSPTAAAIGQSSIGSYGVWVSVPSALHERTALRTDCAV